MDILNKLESIFKVDLSRLKKFKSKVTLIFQVNSNNKNITFNGPVIVINPTQLNKQEADGIEKIIREYVEVGKNPLLLQETIELLKDFKNVDSQEESQSLIAYFTDKIPKTDIEILRQAIFIKVKHENGENINILKDGVIKRYGARGRNICNLYSAGYFSSQIKPLYEQTVSQGSVSLQDFEIAYELIVTASPYAIFINNTMSNDEVVLEIRQKIAVAKNYGVNYLNIHGIGHENVNKIIYALNQLRDEFSTPEDISSKGNVIAVKVHF